MFDPLHYGHIRYLAAAAALDRPLIVRVAPDEAITAKGRTPFQTRQERLRTVEALDYVDRVCAHDSLADAVVSIRPRFLVKGSEWRGKLPEDVLKACRDVGAEIVYTETQERTSSERLRA